jgi:hypothetical protein
MNFDCWKLDFMLLLIEKYIKYTKKHELNSTENILKWTNQYQELTDIYLQFLIENTEETENDNDKIHCSDFYGAFKDWFKFNNPNTKIPSDKEFSKGIKKHKNIEESVRIGDKVKRGIKKIKFISINN